MTMHHEPQCGSCCDGWSGPLPCLDCGRAEMSSLRLTRIRERLAAVPHRYGEVQRYDDSDGSINYQLTIGAHPDSLIWNLADDRAGRAAKATAELLANAPGDLALLLGEVGRLNTEADALRSQRDHLYRLLERIYAWGGLTGTGNRAATPVDDLSEGAVDGTALGAFLYNDPPAGPTWPTPMDDEPNPTGEE